MNGVDSSLVLSADGGTVYVGSDDSYAVSAGGRILATHEFDIKFPSRDVKELEMLWGVMKCQQ